MKKRFRHWDILYAILLFVLIVIFTYFTEHFFYGYYIARKIDNISSVIFSNSFIVSAFWISGLSLSVLFYLFGKRKIRIIPLIIWMFLFLVNIIFWFINLKSVQFSGVEISPFMATQTEGAFGMVINSVKSFSVFIWFFYAILIFTLFIRLIRNIRRSRMRVILFVFLFLFGGFSLYPLASSFRNLQEYIVASNFLSYYAKASSDPVLETDVFSSQESDLGFLSKLKRFGIDYDFNRYAISYHERVYDPSLPPLLPSLAGRNKPNILIVFLESFSNDVTSIYNPKLPGITPNLEKMADNPNTILFRHYYNASTPTVTGLISQLCSFLPPTGHQEMQNDGTLVDHHLLCLPDVLKSNGYRDVFYMHAVEKSFSNKDKILRNAGVDEDRIFGKDEIAALIKTHGLESSVGSEPLSWGYSDHQLYPVFEELIQEAGKEPFLGMMTTIDTHIPYTNSKDIMRYPASPKNEAFDAFYTADDAFGGFWDYFINSELKDNTILIAIADHAAFPAPLYIDAQDLFDGAENKTFYDENLFMMYIPDSTLPKFVDTYSSGIDFTPTLLQVLGINPPNVFEGHSIFYDRGLYPNILGSHEFQLYINQLTDQGERKISFDAPKFIAGYNYKDQTGDLLTLTDYWQYYEWKRKMLSGGHFWKESCTDVSCSVTDHPRLIAHAGGGIQGLTYTNSLEALNDNYDKGFRYFEVDLSWTLDDQLVLIHDWEQTYKNFFNREDGAPYSLFFKNLTMDHGLHQMSLEDLFTWLEKHQDAKIVTDVKERNIDALNQIAQTGYRDYFIVQVYDENEIQMAKELGYKDVILTLYRTDYDNDKVIDIAKKYDLSAITMSQERAAQGDLLKQLSEKNITVYLHTINDLQELSDLEDSGAQGFYTDFLDPKNISNAD